MKGEINIIDIFIYLILFFTFLSFVLFPLHISLTPSQNGRFTGYITHTETSGWLWKNNKVWITTQILGEADSYPYCVRNDILLQRLQEVQKNKSQTTIAYHDEMFVWDWDCPSNTIIDEIIS